MRFPTRSRVLTVAAVVAATLSLTQSAAGDDGFRPLDVTSVAIATSAAPVAQDSAFDTGRLHPRGSSEVSSTATSDCDDCSATSVSVGVVYGQGQRSGSVVAENVATAWSANCTSCSSASVSVQVVVLRKAGSITANNRSLAVNAACAECTASAAAYQLVVISPKGRDLDRLEIRALREWAQAQAQAQSMGASGAAGATGSAGAGAATSDSQKGAGLSRQGADGAQLRGARAPDPKAADQGSRDAGAGEALRQQAAAILGDLEILEVHADVDVAP